MSTAKVLATGIIATAMLASGASAHATDEPRFPVIPGAPAWYTAASDAPYASTDNTSGEQHIVQEDERWHASAWWYGPNGGAPASNEPDIIIETLPKQTGEAGATDPNLIVLSLNAAFPKLTRSLGTELTDGIAIPSGTSVASPTLTFPGDGIIIAQRPPRDCTVTNDMKDPNRFIVDVAMLGENQHRYLTNLTVEFGTRTWSESCASLVGAQSGAEQKAESESAEEPAQKAEEVKQRAETGAEANGENVTEIVQDEAPASGEADAMSPLQVMGTLIVLLAIGGVIAGFVVIARRRLSREFDNSGRSIRREAAHASVDRSGPSVKRSEF